MRSPKPSPTARSPSATSPASLKVLPASANAAPPTRPNQREADFPVQHQQGGAAHRDRRRTTRGPAARRPTGRPGGSRARSACRRPGRRGRARSAAAGRRRTGGGPTARWRRRSAAPPARSTRPAPASGGSRSPNPSACSPHSVLVDVEPAALRVEQAVAPVDDHGAGQRAEQAVEGGERLSWVSTPTNFRCRSSSR